MCHTLRPSLGLQPATGSRIGTLARRRNALLPSRSLRQGARAAWVAGTLALAGCSLLVDDDPSGCDGDACTRDSTNQPPPCKPHTLCDERTLCVEDGPGWSCKPLRTSTQNCFRTYPRDLAPLVGAEVFPFGVVAESRTDLNEDTEKRTYGEPTTRAIELAVDGINATGGIPTPTQSHERKLLFVECNETPTTEAEFADRDQSHLAQIAKHLVDTLRLPAIVGPSTSGAMERFDDHVRTRNVLLISPSATANDIPGLRRLEGQQMNWRTVPPNSLALPSQKAALALVSEALASKEPGASHPETLLLTGTKNSASMHARNLFFREEPIVRTTSEIPYDEYDPAGWPEVVDKVVRAAPRIIVALSTPEFTRSLLPAIERAWMDERPRPWYVQGEGSRTSFAEALKESPDLFTRVLGTAPGRRQSAGYSAFLAAFRAPPSAADAVPGNLAEGGYDAVFLLAYAALKTGAAWPTGVDLARTMSRLGCKQGGVRIANDNFELSSRLIRDDPGGCFDYAGASGEVDFTDWHRESSVTQKEVMNDMSLWCLARPLEADGQPENLTTHFYSATSKKIVPVVDGGADVSLADPTWCRRMTEP